MHHRYNLIFVVKNKLLLLKPFRIEENIYSYISQGKCIYDKNTGDILAKKETIQVISYSLSSGLSQTLQDHILLV